MTKRQYELLVFINEKIKNDGFCPSFDEMKDALGLKSKSGIHRILNDLEERNYIMRFKHRARAIEIINFEDRIKFGVGVSESGAA